MAIGTTLKIAFDAKQVRSGLASVKSSVASIAKAGAGIAKLGTAITALGVAGAVAISAIVVKLDQIGSSGRSGDRRLQSITKQMGLFGDEAESVANRLIEAADAEAQLTGIDPQLVQTKLMTFKELAKTANEVGGAFDRATSAALDMEAAGFGTAEQNAVQLGKALNDPIKGINSLARSGITFTTQEKAKIATLVQSNKMLEAQTIILKAIETQVGGTAAASATASSRMGKSMQLVVESFAEEMSVAFDQVPGKFQSIMPKLMAIGGRAGKIVADALSDAIAGDFDRFIAIGGIIGDSIGTGMKAAVTSAWVDLGNFMNTRKNWITGEVNKDDAARNERDKSQVMGGMREDLILRITEAIKNISGTGANNVGFVPGSNNQFKFAPPGSTSNLRDGNGNQVVEVLKRIEVNTKEGAKM